MAVSPPWPQPHHQPRSPSKTNLASCFVAAAFLILLISTVAIVFFILFRPRDPTISVSAVQLPGGFSGGNGTVSFTFSQYAAVRNPNRDAFSHYDSTLQLVYGGSQVGFMFIPAGEIGGGRTQYMAASFAVDKLPMAAGGGSVEMESKMRMKGRIRVLRFFTHPVETVKGCRVGVESRDGSVIGFRC
ncbi:hypothetical protein J5N97_026051 [Dioscorea zingiberensis]|uniref:Late embryogenesis abundant protein LEA-2 subgroup domain-containing protein n=1 Tax=Dioscorea zingiberensis TaxID=325984 RepID=A0A9D5C2A4_9LILI|nr:hypothetical protein J5N97_026051 [Dioscorea zingiberensis]